MKVRHMKILGVILVVLMISGGCAATRPPDLSPAEQEYVIDDTYLEGVRAAEEDFRGYGPLAGVLLPPSVVMIVAGNTGITATGIILGVSGVGLATWGNATTPDTIPHYHLAGLKYTEQASFTRGYEERIKLLRSENANGSLYALGFSAVMTFLLLVSNFSGAGS